MQTPYSDNMRKAFNLERISDVYVQLGHLTEASFDKILKDTVRVRALHLPDLDWLLLDHLLSIKAGIPFEAHFKALAAGLGIDYTGIEEFYRHAIAQALLPPRALNRTVFFQVPQEARRTGELAVALGVLSERSLQLGLGIQASIRDALHIEVALGQVLRSVGDISVNDLFQVLGLQAHIPFVNLNVSAPEIARLVESARGGYLSPPPPNGQDVRNRL